MKDLTWRWRRSHSLSKSNLYSMQSARKSSCTHFLDVVIHCEPMCVCVCTHGRVSAFSTTIRLLLTFSSCFVLRFYSSVLLSSAFGLFNISKMDATSNCNIWTAYENYSRFSTNVIDRPMDFRRWLLFDERVTKLKQTYTNIETQYKHISVSDGRNRKKRTIQLRSQSRHNTFSHPFFLSKFLGCL